MPQIRRHDIGQFGKATAAQEGLEEARRLEDPQGCRRDPAIGDFKIERAFALDPGEQIDQDAFSRHGPSSPSGRVRPPH